MSNISLLGSLSVV